MIYSFLSCFQGPPPFPQLDFGLWACVFSAVLLPLEPTIPFSHCSAVSHSKSRDFRLYEPAILFSYWSAVSHSKTRDFRFPWARNPFFSHWSAVSPHRKFLWSRDRSRPIRSQHLGPYGRSLLLKYYIPKFILVHLWNQNLLRKKELANGVSNENKETCMRS